MKKYIHIKIHNIQLIMLIRKNTKKIRVSYGSLVVVVVVVVVLVVVVVVVLVVVVVVVVLLVIVV